jgi:YidC/Oxa1 family membrane protein insertase
VRRIIFLRLAAISSILLILMPVALFGQSRNGENSWLPLAEVNFADNGDLIGWKVSGIGKDTSELIETAEHFLVIEMSQAGRNLSDQVIWRRLPPTQGKLGHFVGRLSDPEIEVVRSYQPGIDVGTIVHEVRITTQSSLLPSDLRMSVKILPNLHRHTSGDRTLGRLIYGYSRAYGVLPDSNSKLEPIREQRQVTAAALAVRHIAVVVAPEAADNGSVVASPNLGVTQVVDTLQNEKGYRQVFGALELSGSASVSDNYRHILYSDLWWPIRVLARQIENALQILASLVGNVGVAIIIFAIFLRAILLPLGLWSIREQRSFARVQNEMKPKIDHINSTYKGAEKSERILGTYKEHGISPFSGLKGSMGLLIQLPILIAFFAVTTESALFRDATFLWATDLSLPDRAMSLSYSIPGMGAYLNLLPIILGIVSIAAAYIQVRSGAAASPRSGLILALVFVGLFYSCAAALVLYWLVVNVAQIFEGLYVTRSVSTSASK